MWSFQKWLCYSPWRIFRAGGGGVVVFLTGCSLCFTHAFPEGLPQPWNQVPRACPVAIWTGTTLAGDSLSPSCQLSFQLRGWRALVSSTLPMPFTIKSPGPSSFWPHTVCIEWIKSSKQSQAMRHSPAQPHPPAVPPYTYTRWTRYKEWSRTVAVIRAMQGKGAPLPHLTGVFRKIIFACIF